MCFQIFYYKTLQFIPIYTYKSRLFFLRNIWFEAGVDTLGARCLPLVADRIAEEWAEVERRRQRGRRQRILGVGRYR